MTFEVRYERSFLQDLRQLEPVTYKRVFLFVFVEFLQIKRLKDLPDFRPLASQMIFYRFCLDDYLIALEVTGNIIKFVRILPKPKL